MIRQKVSGNASKSGIQNGDTVVYTSSFFGDELWPSDDINFTKSALNACPSPACIVYVRMLISWCSVLAPLAAVSVVSPCVLVAWQRWPDCALRQQHVSLCVIRV